MFLLFVLLFGPLLSPLRDAPCASDLHDGDLNYRVCALGFFALPCLVRSNYYYFKTLSQELMTRLFFHLPFFRSAKE